MATPISDVKEIVLRAAECAGFDLVGVAPAADAAELKHFPEWIAAGRAGEMKYMEARDDQGDLKRASLARSRLQFVASALKRLLADDHFLALLRAEGLQTIPRALAERIGPQKA